MIFFSFSSSLHKMSFLRIHKQRNDNNKSNTSYFFRFFFDLIDLIILIGGYNSMGRLKESF